MGLFQFLIGFPLIVLVMSVAVQGQNFQGGNTTFAICNPNDPGNARCLQNSNGTTTYTCPGPKSCAIAFSCPANPPPPSYCSDVGVGPRVWTLPPGTSVTVPSDTPTGTQSSSNGFFFNFGSVGPSGFIAFIGIAVGIVVLAGLSIFGSGMSAESVHILFMGGLMLAIWIFLSGLDGFLSGSSGSLFVQLDRLAATIGTEFYVILTLMYFFGFMLMVKRGGGGV